MTPASACALETPRQRRERYRDNVRYVFGATAELYYAYWGEFFHFAIFDGGDGARTSPRRSSARTSDTSPPSAARRRRASSN